MLKLTGISKTYKTGDLVQVALKDVDISFRESEFVAILGPSGSGKTTLLNIIGGLDRYDEGDLIINNVSTKKYKDRDWDSYRNHSVGFVFQSYNLIPHQTILANVEMALTIGGITGKERRRRALEALDEVGLYDQAHKKPNQLSGGQMQRVAIARALVNDPKILLADEPTGALDTVTSVQVMDLLKEVAKDRLVVMVTHNPELADQYANRIVKLRDGQITDDSNPYYPEKADKAVHKNLGRASMSFFTSLGLSFNNLLTKKARTILTAFAGSIGIIGIALILSLSTGFQKYIDKMQEDTMVSYPLSIQSETANLFSIMLSMQGNSDKEVPEGNLEEYQIISSMQNSVRKNDLKHFKKYLETHPSEYEEYVKTVRYSYSVVPLIYTVDVKGNLAQINPNDSLSSVMGTSGYMGISSFSMSIFNEVSGVDAMESGNILLAGRMPEKYNELAVIVTGKGQISDILAYTLGLKDTSKLKPLFQSMMLGERSAEIEDPITVTYDDILGLELKLVDPTDKYRYNEKYDIYEDMSSDLEYMKAVYDRSEDLVVTAVLCSENGNSSSGVMYFSSLTDHVIELASKSEILKKQMEKKDIDVFSGKRFDDDTQNAALDFSDMISVDANKLSSAFSFNMPAMNMGGGMSAEDSAAIISDTAEEIYDSMADPQQIVGKAGALMAINGAVVQSLVDEYEESNLSETDGNEYLSLDNIGAFIESIDAAKYKDAMSKVDMSSVYENLSFDTGDLDPEEVEAFLENVDLGSMGSLFEDSDFEELANAASSMFNAYYAQVTESPEVSEGSIAYQKTEEETVYGSELKSGDLMNAALSDRDGNQALLRVAPNFIKNLSVLTITGQVGSAVGSVTAPLAEAMSGLYSAFSGNFMTVNENMLAEAFKFDLSEEELTRLMSTMSSGSATSYSNNLLKLGYQDMDEPTSISFYFNDFASKNSFTDFMKEYNNKAKDEYKIRYTDITGILLKSVEKIINSVSYVLIAFVSISLVVSSIMIGIITYISVLERTKEIGILRALGASKRNISSIFNAETFIIGILSGLIGVGITYVLIRPINKLIFKLTENADIKAVLPAEAAVALIGVATVLTMIGGLIPSKSASKKDPVIALRTE
ncbi:MAG: ABC transporter ATP-binding protein/permease [Firmicutes bacterium]|nr:ABC transporter ATP-binding protein/permease [Bacillota bacterium]